MPRSKPSFNVALGLALLCAAACDEHIGCEPVLRTENEQLELKDLRVVAGACEAMRGPGPVLEGTRLCPEIQCNPDVDGCDLGDDERLPEATVRACFDQSASGEAELIDDCMNFNGPGMVTWEFTARACAANDEGFNPVDDRLVLPGVAAADVTAHFVHPGDAFALRNTDPGPRSEFPQDAQLGPDLTPHVLADHAVELAVVLQHPDHLGPVAWNPADFTLVVDPPGVPIAEPRWQGGVVALALPAGGEVNIAVERGPDRFEVGTVRGVDESDLDSLEIVVGYRQEDDDAYGHPIGARAVVRTADGTPVYGAPVEWDVTEGAFPLWRDGDMFAWGADYTALIDDDGQVCHAVPKERTTYEATLEASYAGLDDAVEIEWTEEEPDKSFGDKVTEFFRGPASDESERCVGPGFPAQGCGCHQSGGGPAAALLLLVLFGLRRRGARHH